jgi:hypothetical protein
MMLLVITIQLELSNLLVKNKGELLADRWPHVTVFPQSHGIGMIPLIPTITVLAGGNMIV